MAYLKLNLFILAATFFVSARAFAVCNTAYQPPGDVAALSDATEEATHRASGCQSVQRTVEGGSSYYYSCVGHGPHGATHMPPSRIGMDPHRIAFAMQSVPLCQIICVQRLHGDHVGHTVCGPVLDRGPYANSRIVDSWPAAAAALGLAQEPRAGDESDHCAEAAAHRWPPPRDGVGPVRVQICEEAASISGAFCQARNHGARQPAERRSRRTPRSLQEMNHDMIQGLPPAE